MQSLYNKSLYNNKDYKVSIKITKSYFFLNLLTTVMGHLDSKQKF